MADPTQTADFKLGVENNRVILISSEKHDTRILTPREHEKFREQLGTDYKVIVDAMLHTGLRVEELKEVIKNPKWFYASARCIDLPRGVMRKKKSLFRQRSVKLSIKGVEAIEALIALGLKSLSSRSAMNEAFKRAARKAGIGEQGITPKMYRKTLISWLVACYPDKHILIAMHSGHSVEVMQKHYLGINFERNDVEDMRSYLRGWGE
jgi:integrase